MMKRFKPCDGRHAISLLVRNDFLTLYTIYTVLHDTENAYMYFVVPQEATRSKI